MNKREACMPDIRLGGNADYDTLVSVLKTWAVKVRMPSGGTIFGEVLGYTYPNILKLAPWDSDPGVFDHDHPVSVDLDCVEAIFIQ